jgi:hypothetical protein
VEADVDGPQAEADCDVLSIMQMPVDCYVMTTVTHLLVLPMLLLSVFMMSLISRPRLRDCEQEQRSARCTTNLLSDLEHAAPHTSSSP